ncbi:ABC transporter substrate-binding protein [Jeotgalibacillus proteolyticus]|nr:ABC transporter substrate-binding protein [Jeotgalibacillus proteolyticus]
MKKVSAFTLAVFLLSTFLVACGGDSDSGGGEEDNGKTNLTFWTPLSGGDGDFMKELVSEFNSENAEIEVELLNLKAEEYYTKMRTSVTSDQAPDVAIAHTSKLSELESANLIVSIEDAADSAGVEWDTFSENIVDATIIKDEHYAVPLDTHALIMYANNKILAEADLLDESGQPVIEDGEEGFIQFLEKIKENSPSGTFPLSATSTGDSPLRMWWTFYSQLGGELLNEEGSQAAFNNEQGLEALSFLGKMVEDDLWPKNIANGGELFTAQKAAIHINGVWMTGALENNEGLEFSAIPIPQVFDEQAMWGDSHLFVVPRQNEQSDEKKEASIVFANWIADHSSSWAQAGHVPSKPSVIESEEFQELPYRSDYAEIGEDVSYMPNTPKLTAINDVLKKHFNQYMTGDVSPEDTLSNAEEEVNNLLK